MNWRCITHVIVCFEDQTAYSGAFISFPFIQGESFYNPYIPSVLELLSQKGLIEESEGARVIFIEGKNIPLIVVKKDGGYNYASTDLAALWLVI